MRSRWPVLVDWIIGWHEPFWTEVFSAAAAIAWSKWVWLGHWPLAAYPGWVAAAHAYPEWIWDVAGCMIGGVQIAAICRRNRRARCICAVALTGFWALLTANMVISLPGSPTAAILAVLTAQTLLSVVYFSALRLRRLGWA